MTWLGRDSGGRGGHLDPENPPRREPGPSAQVLDDKGVPVDVVRGRKAFDAAKVDARTTVVVSNAEALGSSTFADVEDRVRATPGSVLVIAGLSPVVADGIGLTDKDFSTATERDRTPADCEPARPLLDGLTLTLDGSGIGVPGDGCFGDAAGRLLLVDPTGHRWVLVDGTPSATRRSTATTTPRSRCDCSASATGWSGTSPTPPRSRPARPTDLGRLLPRWLVPSAWLLAIAASSRCCCSGAGGSDRWSSSRCR